MPIRLFAALKRTVPPPLPERVDLATPAGPVAVAVRFSPRARRLTLRCRPADGGFELVVPPRVATRQALDFLQSQAGWVGARLAALEPHTALVPGAELPLLGGLVRILSDPAQRTPAVLAEGCLTVGGRPEFLARRVTDFLKVRARAEIVPRARDFAARLDRPLGRITLRDPKSRWGSCSPSGDLAFSWRLVLAPEPVLTYVVAHEAAHLVELNHSARFWAVVDRLVPDAAASRLWLRRNGARLLRIG